MALKTENIRERVKGRVLRTHIGSKQRDRKRSHLNNNRKRAKVAILILDKIGFKSKW